MKTIFPPPVNNKFWMTCRHTESGKHIAAKNRKSLKIITLPGILEVDDRIRGSFLLWWTKDDADCPISLSRRDISETLASCVVINADTAHRSVLREIHPKQNYNPDNHFPEIVYNRFSQKIPEYFSKTQLDKWIGLQKLSFISHSLKIELSQLYLLFFLEFWLNFTVKNLD